MFDVFGSFSNKITLVVVSFLDWRTAIASWFMMVHVVDWRDHKTLFKKSKSTSSFSLNNSVMSACTSRLASTHVHPIVCRCFCFVILVASKKTQRLKTTWHLVKSSWMIGILKNDKFCGHHLLCALIFLRHNQTKKIEQTLWIFWIPGKAISIFDRLHWQWQANMRWFHYAWCVPWFNLFISE